GAEHLRDAAGIENPGTLQRDSVTALGPYLAAHSAELQRMDLLDRSRAGEHHDRIRDLAQREPAHKRAAHDGLDVFWRIVTRPCVEVSLLPFGLGHAWMRRADVFEIVDVHI